MNQYTVAVTYMRPPDMRIDPNVLRTSRWSNMRHAEPRLALRRALEFWRAATDGSTPPCTVDIFQQVFSGTPGKPNLQHVSVHEARTHTVKGTYGGRELRVPRSEIDRICKELKEREIL